MPEMIPIRIPRGGERGDIPDHEQDMTSFRVLSNMLVDNNGRLVLRDGYEKLATTGPGGRIQGLHYFQTAAAADRTVAANRTQLWTYDGTTWTNRTGGTALTASTTQLSRFLTFPISGVYNVLHCNEVDALQIWNGSAATFSDAGGSPPVVVDMAEAANRVLALVNPDNIRISDFNNPEVWPAALTARLTSGDIKIGMEQMGRLAVGIYGEDSQWIARAQQGTFPFRFERIDSKPGPLSKACIVGDGNIHYYLATDGIIYRNDGVQVLPWSAAMQNYVLANLNHINRRMAHGVLIRRIKHIFWFFPSGTASAPNIGVYLDLNLDPRTKVPSRAMGRLAIGEITASSKWLSVSLVSWNSLSTFTWNNLSATYPTWDSFGGTAERREIFGDSSGQVHAFGSGDGSDNGNAIEGIAELPLAPLAGMDKNAIPMEFDTWWRKTTNSTTVTPRVRVTDTLAAEPSLINLTSFDLSVDSRKSVDLVSAAGAEGKRFVSVGFQVSATRGGVEWLGGLLRTEEAEAEAGPTPV